MFYRDSAIVTPIGLFLFNVCDSSCPGNMEGCGKATARLTKDCISVPPIFYYHTHSQIGKYFLNGRN